MKHGGYGKKARIGLVTPQANPTAEPEIQSLLPSGVSLLSTRSTSGGQPRERLIEYFEQLDQTLASFDTLELDVAAFACTASSYLLDIGAQQRKLHQLQQHLGYPVITAAAAIHQALQHLGVHRIAIACPYPEWLFERAVSYWQNQDFQITAALSVQPDMDDTRAIYDVDPVRASEQMIASFEDIEADAYLITGTGMPGLQAIVDLQNAFGKPAMNSNLCLAWACLRTAGVPLGDRGPTDSFPLLSGWQDELARIFHQSS